MAENIQPLKELTEQEQALHFFSRERRKSNFDPTFKLFRTDFVANGDTLLIADFGSVVSSPVTFKIKVRCDTLATANGVVFELGGATGNVGMAVYVDGGDVGLAVRGLAPAVVTDAFGADDHEITIVAAINATGMQLWCDDLTDFVAEATPANIFPWAGAANGEVGGIDGTVTGAVPAGQRVNLVNATIISPLSIYRKQRPRVMNV